MREVPSSFFVVSRFQTSHYRAHQVFVQGRVRRLCFRFHGVWVPWFVVPELELELEFEFYLVRLWVEVEHLFVWFLKLYLVHDAMKHWNFSPSLAGVYFSRIEGQGQGQGFEMGWRTAGFCCIYIVELGRFQSRLGRSIRLLRARRRDLPFLLLLL